MNDFNLQTSIRDLAFILFKRKWSLLTVLAVASISAAAYLLLIRDDLYQASARILVRIGHEQEPPATVLNERMMIVGQRYQDVNSEADILTSADLLGQIVDELGLDKPGPPEPPPEKIVARVRYEAKKYVKFVKDWKNELLIKVGFRTRLTPREEAMAMLAKGMLVTPQKDSNVLAVHLILPSRQFAAPILNRLIDRYLDFRLKLFLDKGVEEFFRGEVTRSRDALAGAETALHEFETRHGIIALDNQEEVLLRQLSEAESALTSADVEARIAGMKVAQLEKELDAEEPDFAALGAFDRTSFPESIMLQLAELQKKREVLRMTPVSESATLENNQRQADVLMRLIASNLRSYRAEKDRAQQQHQAAVERIEKEVKDLHAQRARWSELQRNVKVQEASYLFYQNRLQQASSTAAMERDRVGNVEVIERAIDPLAPAGIRKVTLLGMSMGIALLAALAYVAVLEFFDHRIYAAPALERRLDAPVLGVVPVMGLWGRREWKSGHWQSARRV